MRSGGVDNKILSFSFNQDASLLALGTKEGTRWYRTDPFEKYRENKDDASVLAMHYNTDLVAQVGAAESATSSQRAVRMLNYGLDKEITKKHFEKPVLDVKLNADRVVVVLEETIYIFSLTEMKLLHTIEGIPGNVDGLCALPGLKRRTPDAQNLLAYPFEKKDVHGNVHLFDVVHLRAGVVIEAHSSRVRCLSFNDDGTMLATASIKGTVIRVFGTPSGEKLFELRRGMVTSATIFSMAFDATSTLLAASSDHPTIHIFKLEAAAAAPPVEDDGGWSAAALFRSAVETASSILPTPVSEMWTQARSFAQISLPESGNPSLCAICGGGDEPYHVLVATSEGILYKYRLDPEEGGECERMIRYPLCESAMDLITMSASQAAEAEQAATEGEGAAAAAAAPAPAPAEGIVGADTPPAAAAAANVDAAQVT
mmetsp:Transcript_33604/g.88263  ORF Transcript_33604/g.88263 Transcript_33604/m.88263 type:complete len:428 (+) Transcript_33604:297-1580(+)